MMDLTIPRCLHLVWHHLIGVRVMTRASIQARARARASIQYEARVRARVSVRSRLFHLVKSHLIKHRVRKIRNPI